MPKIKVNNPKYVIESHLKTNYFKLKNTGGPKGDKGDKGDTGTAATISAGTASSLPAGSAPTVTNSGTSSAAVFNFGIPKGDKGDKGDTGATGAAATITVGSTTTGAAGTNASVTNSGTSGAAVLNFTIPRGDKGETGATGATGATGQAATIAVGSTTTLAPGSNATVTNSGTSSAATFDFGIPQGVKGDTGSVKSTVVSELPASGNSDTFYLVDREAQTGTASGTFITIDNPEPNGEISDYDILGNSEQQALPDSYQAVEFIESTGTQYINTGLTATAGQVWSAEITLQYTGSPTGNTVMLSAGANAWFGQSGGFYAIGGSFRSTTSATVKATARISFGSDVSMTINDENISRTMATDAGTFNIFRAGSGDYYSRAKLYSCKMYNSAGTMVRNFVPCYQKSNNAIGLYDLVDGTFYANAGSGSFTKGNDTTVTPAPDAPQAIEVVTGEQEVDICGKNLFYEIHDDFGINGNTGEIMQIANRYARVARVKAGQTYNTSRSAVGDSSYFWVGFFATKPEIGLSSITFSDMGASVLDKTITAPAGANYCVVFYGAGTSPDSQLELGPTATAYEPYQAQEYPIDLGSIELAKIGTYQDYIWNDGGTWKIHKEVGKMVLDGSETWAARGTQYTGYLGVYTTTKHFGIDGNFLAPANFITDHFKSGDGTYNATYGQNISSTQYAIYATIDSSITADAAAFQTWLSSNPTAVYYTLATPTDTAITDTNLIAQLDALLDATLYNGQNNIAVTSSTQPTGSLDLTYAMFDAANRHKVYIWSNSDNTWQIIVQ